MNQPYSGAEDQSAQPKPYVANISLVKGVPFYGFHVGWKYYAKIYLLNPRYMKRLSMILQSGGVMGTTFQPYEAHIQYLLQFMVDYNLYGCGFIECENVRFRQGVPDMEKVADKHVWHNGSIPQKLMLPEGEFPRQSYCELEVDIQIQNITNRRGVSERRLHHNFIERLDPTPPDKKLLHSLAELWKDENMRRGSTDQLNMEGFVVSSGSREPCADWMHEEDKRDKILAMIKAESQRGDGSNPHFENFVRREPLENLVQTALESVRDFYPDGSREMLIPEDEDGDDGVDVNDDIIGDLDEEDFIGEDDYNELTEIDKEIFDPLADEEEEGQEFQKPTTRSLDKKGKGKGQVKEPVDVPMEDVPSPLDKYGHLGCGNQNLFDPSIEPHSQCYRINLDTNPPDDVFEVPPKFVKHPKGTVEKKNCKRQYDEFKNNSYEIPQGYSTRLKRKNPPDISVLEPKCSKIETTDVGNFPKKNRAFTIPPTPRQEKIGAQGSLKGTHTQSKQVSSTVDPIQVPIGSSPISPGAWDFPVLKAETLRLSQEISSQDVHRKPQETAVNAPHKFVLNTSISLFSQLSDITTGYTALVEECEFKHLSQIGITLSRY